MTYDVLSSNQYKRNIRVLPSDVTSIDAKFEVDAVDVAVVNVFIADQSLLLEDTNIGSVQHANDIFKPCNKKCL